MSQNCHCTSALHAVAESYPLIANSTRGACATAPAPARSAAAVHVVPAVRTPPRGACAATPPRPGIRRYAVAGSCQVRTPPGVHAPPPPAADPPLATDYELHRGACAATAVVVRQLHAVRIVP
ncbi:hypothetical protein CYMTET_35465, partial [Cymbomonas tetramitiformis]